MTPSVTQDANTDFNISGETSESILQINSTIISFKSVNTIFYLEIISVLIFFGIFWYAVASPTLPEFGGFIYLFFMAFPLIFFIILNIIGFFVFSTKIDEYKNVKQRIPVLLKVLNGLSKLVVIMMVLLVICILIEIFS